MKTKKLTVIIKAVGNSCNLKCSYCYFNHLSQNKLTIMSEDVLENFIKQYLSICKTKAVFIWHGGEPLVAGIDFYKKALELQKKYNVNNVEIINKLQTNATLINDTWAIFFRENNFSVGVSIDGTEASHNKFRINNSLKGSWTEVMNGVNILRNHNIKVGFFHVITNSSIKSINEDFIFFRDILKTKSWSFSPFLDAQNNNPLMIDESISDTDYSTYIRQYIDKWLNSNDSNLTIRDIENLGYGVFGRKAKICSYNGTCGEFFCIDHNGDIYPCGKFAYNEEYNFGNIKFTELIKILENEKRIKYLQLCKKLPVECQTCNWVKSCNNGCTYHRINGPDKKYYYCNSRRDNFEYLQSIFSSN